MQTAIEVEPHAKLSWAASPVSQRWEALDALRGLSILILGMLGTSSPINRPRPRTSPF